MNAPALTQSFPAQPRLLAEDTIEFKMTSGKYDPDFVAGIWRLFDLRVALDNINPVIEAVFGLIGKKVAHLPARTTLMMMSGSRLPACQVQIAEVIACCCCC